jgi:hypothetical protein
MIDQNRNFPSAAGRNLRTGDQPISDSSIRTTPVRAMWSAVAAAAIITVMFVVFYGINAEQNASTQTVAYSPTVIATPAPETANGGPAPVAPENKATQQPGGQ